MPSIFSHIAVPVAARVALGGRRVPWAMLAAGMVAAVLPDIDGVAHQFGIAAHGMWGHRGYTHTLGFALLVGAVGALLAPRWGLARWKGFAWMALCAFSHPLLDCMTNGGAAVPLLWPLEAARYRSPWHPIAVAPLDIHRFFSPRGVAVAKSELLFVWLPLMALALLWRITHKKP
jgi:inner membrane protein